MMWSAWPCVMIAARMSVARSRINCRRSSGPASIISSPSGARSRTPERVRRFRGLLERHTSQQQPTTGTPMLVPVPMMTISAITDGKCAADRADAVGNPPSQVWQFQHGKKGSHEKFAAGQRTQHRKPPRDAVVKHRFRVPVPAESASGNRVSADFGWQWTGFVKTARREAVKFFRSYQSYRLSGDLSVSGCAPIMATTKTLTGLKPDISSGEIMSVVGK